MTARQRGQAGEMAAAAYLRTHGFAVEAVNVRSRFGEVDIVARRGDELAFVEVKTRGQHRYGSGAAAVTPRKQARIVHAAKHYWARHGRPHDRLRFDVIEVMAVGDAVEVANWYQNAFEAQE